MQLQFTEVAARAQRMGQQDSIVVNAGQLVCIETSPNGEDILNVEVPEGKRWMLSVAVDIRETDV